MLRSIKNIKDIKIFLEETNSLHDGYVVKVRYNNDGISKIEGGHYFEPSKTKLVLQILVTSIWMLLLKLNLKIFWNGKSKTIIRIFWVFPYFLTKRI